MHLKRPFESPTREEMSWEETWVGTDQGLIKCWERGREMRIEKPHLAKRADRGELVTLAWKGGVDKKLKAGWKYGTLYYLAMLQGLRGENLQIDTDQDIERVCTRTGMRVIYTGDFERTKNA